MWRAYAGHGGGFCLESEPELGASDFSIDETWFLRLSYGKEFPPRVRDLLDVVAVLLEETKDDPLVEFVATNRTRLVTMKLKQEGFSEEKEWRVLALDPPREILQFRQGHSDIKPYVELTLKNDGPKKPLPLRKIVFGPSLRHGDTLTESLQMMLDRNGYENVEIESSGIPFRL